MVGLTSYTELLLYAFRLLTLRTMPHRLRFRACILLPLPVVLKGPAMTGRLFVFTESFRPPVRRTAFGGVVPLDFAEDVPSHLVSVGLRQTR